MTQRVVYEVLRDDSGWLWRLCDGDVVVAVSPERYDSARETRAAIDRVRAAVVSLANADGFYFPHDPDETSTWIRIRSAPDANVYEWGLVGSEDVVAITAHTYRTRRAAQNAADRFATVAVGGVPVYLVGNTAASAEAPFVVRRSSVREAVGALRWLLWRGRSHREYLDDIDTRIVVSGIRGKSSTVRLLDDVFNRRGYDVLTKITGNHPTLLRNGDVIPIERTGPYTTLYENIDVLREFGSQLRSYAPEDVAVFENQGITEYTTRLINERFLRPQIVVVANVRQDHQDTLGKTLGDLARAFARTIPAGTTVVNGEQNDVLAEYMRREIRQQDAEMVRVTIPSDQRGRIGAETVYACNDVLRLLDTDPIPEAQLNAYLDAIQPRWVQLPRGRVYNGAEINDIESTEAVRAALAGDSEVLPFVYLRADRRSRSASFARYLNTLADRGVITRARAGGSFTDVFARHVDVPVTEHAPTEDAGVVLDGMLDEGLPVLLMGNTVEEFMRDMQREIDRRATAAAVEGTGRVVASADAERLDTPE